MTFIAGWMIDSRGRLKQSVNSRLEMRQENHYIKRFGLKRRKKTQYILVRLVDLVNPASDLVLANA